MTNKFTSGDIEEIIFRLRAKGFRSLESGRDPLRGTATAGHNHAGVYEPAITSGTSSQVLLGDKTLGTPSTVNGSSGLGQTILTPFAVYLGAGGASTTTDGQTTYWGGCSGASPAGGASNTQCVFVPLACKIVGASIWANCGTVGTGEDWPVYIRKNNTTDTLVQTLASTASQRVWSNYSLDISLAQGDRFEIKAVNPTWATNPANVRWGGLLHLVPN